VPVAGGKSQVIREPFSGINTIHLHPDGHRIAFGGTSPTAEEGIWVLENFLPKTKDKK